MKPCLWALVVGVVTAGGGASVSMVASWKDRTVPARSYRDILVVGITQKQQMRQVFEEVLAAELRKKGVAAIPSYTLTGVTEKQSREALEKAVQAAGADAVLTTRVVARQRETVTSVGYVMTDRGYTNPSFSGSQVMPVELYTFYGAGVVSYATFDMKSVEVTTAATATVETNLFDVATKRLVWSGTTTAAKPAGIITVSEEFAGVVGAALSKEGFIP